MTLRTFALAASVLGAFSTAGCRLDVVRTRAGSPLRLESYRALEAKKTTLEEAVAALGTPDRIEWEGDLEYIYWEYLDDTAVNFRLQSPLSFFGYRHTFFQYLTESEATDRIQLVFDRSGVLQERSLRLGKETKRGPAGYRFHISPRFEHSFLRLGDADIADFEDIVRDGYLAGLEFGYQPVPPLVLRAAGHYQRFPGRTIRSGSSRIAFEDLELYSGEAGIRVQVPVRILARIGDLAEVAEILREEDPRAFDGWLLFVEGGVGATVNANLPVRVDGRRAGDFFDASPVLTSTGAFGIEYSTEVLSLRVHVGFRSTDPFDEGDSGLPDDATSFQTWTAGISASVKF